MRTAMLVRRSVRADIEAIVSVERVVSCAAVDCVVACSTEDRVVSVAPADDVVATLTADRVVAAEANNDRGWSRADRDRSPLPGGLTEWR